MRSGCYDAEYYDAAYYDEQGKSNYHGYTRASSPFAAHADLIERVIADFDLGRTVLDVGCAKGYLVEELRSRGVQAQGVDWSQYAVDQADPDVRPFLRQASALDLPYPDGAFDLVVSFDVLEHLDVASARRAMAECARVSRRQLHQVNTGRLDEWLFHGDDSHCTQLSLEQWTALAADGGLTGTILCEPDGRLPYHVLPEAGVEAARPTVA